MKLEYVLNCPERSGEWAKRFSALELYLNPGSPSGWSGYKEGISEAYDPMNYVPKAPASYRLIEPLRFPFYWVELENLVLLEANPSSEVLTFLDKAQDKGKGIRFVIHADAQKQLPIQRKPDGYIRAYLTASTRTVVTADGYPLHLKLDYPGIIGRCPRRLELPDLQQSTFFSRKFDMWSMSGVLSPKFGYLPESLGILWKLDDNQTIGMIGREVVVPRPEVNQQRVLIPFFALAKKDEGCPEDLTLLTQLICWNSSVGATPRDVFLHLTGLIFGAIRSLFDRQQVSGGTQVDKYRLIHDSHAQNILLQLDSNGYPQRVIWRDFQHIYPVVLDQEDNLDDLVEQHPFLKVLDMCKEPQYVVKKMSQLIDTKLGMYVLEPLITNFATDFNCHRKDIIANVRDQFRETLGPINQILRKGVWYRRSKGMKYDDLGRIRLVKGRGTPLLRN